jgi:hypothetical protein
MSHDRLPDIASNSLNDCLITFCHILCVIDRSHKMDFGNERSLMNEIDILWRRWKFISYWPAWRAQKRVVALSRCGNIKSRIECKFWVSACLSTYVSKCLQVSLSSKLFRRQLVVSCITKKIHVFMQPEVFTQWCLRDISTRSYPQQD